MNPEEIERQLVRLSNLVSAAGKRLDELGRNVDALRSVIDEIEAVLINPEDSSDDSDNEAANGTRDSEVAQVEVVTK